MRFSLCLAAALLCAAPAMAGVLDVPATYPTIQAALDAAISDDVVLVQPGNYHEALVFPGRSLLLVSAGGAAVTTIDASGLGQRVMTMAPFQFANFTVRGFTITGGTASGPSPFGGGVSVSHSTLALEQCTITGNSAGQPGGPSGSGGGVWAEAGITLQDCSVLGNQQYGADGSGGGLMGLFIVAKDCLIAGNTAEGSGGGASGGSFTGCTFEANVANLDGGGMVRLFSVSGPVEDCRFVGNIAGGSGGGIRVRVTGGLIALASLARCTFVGNHAASGGGALVSAETATGLGYVSVANCVFADNAALSGDGLLATSIPAGVACVRFCTFDGDGIVASRELNVNHGIVRGPWGGAPFVSLAGGPIAVSWSDVEGGWPGTGNFDADPLFVDPAAGDGHISLGSPCVDAGQPGAVPGQGGFACEVPALDRDGEPRVQNGRLDVGADESQADCNASGTGDLDDIAAGTAADCDGNLVPDECESYADCNGNGVSDACDVESGFSIDCNANGLPDECEGLPDCNGNGTPDGCDLALGTSHDCNGNGLPDECDIASGTSLDADADGFPDECKTVLHVPAEFTTIQAAINEAGDSDLILLAPGTYADAGNVELEFLGKVLTIEGEGGWAACVIDGAGAQIASLGAAESGGVTLRGLTLRNAVSPSGGALMARDGAVLHVEDCVFTACTAVQGGGAVSAQDGSSLTLTRCVFLGNDAQNGGALRFSDADGVIEHCTFEHNEAVQRGGTIHAQAGSQLVVRDSILHGGKAAIGMELSLQGAGTLLGISYSNLAGGEDGIALGHHVWGAGMIEAPPLFADPAAGDLHLKPGSPCINSGDPGGAADPDGSPPDMGALGYEPWTVLGGGIPGSFGLPLLVANGPLTDDTLVHWTLSHGPPGAGFVLVVGFAQAGLPFHGGVLWPVPHALLALNFGHLGEAAGHGRWPPGAPAGTGLWLQAWFADGGAAQGLAASDGVRGLSP